MIENFVIVTPYFAPAWGYGGPPRVLFNLAKQLVLYKKKVTVITTDALDQRRSYQTHQLLEGINIYRFKTLSNTLAYRLKIFFSFNLLSKSKHILDSTDFVFFSDFRTFLNWQLYPYVKKKGIPYGVFAFGQIPYSRGVKSYVKKVLDFFWVRDFIKSANFQFAQTLHEQEMFRKHLNIPVSQTYLLPLPVETIKTIKKKELANNFKKKWAIAETDQVLLFVGRLHFLKGVDLLIKAVKPLLEKNKYLKLLIVGRDDGEEKKLRTMAEGDVESQIIFTGPLYDKDVYCAYACASCFVITPRFYEETSVAALEALSFGIPVVTTKESDIPYLEKYQAGFVVENSCATIQDAITALLEKMKGNAKEIRKNAKKLINDQFSCPKITKQLLKIIENDFE